MPAKQPITCPLCNESVDKLLYPFHLESERRVMDRIKEQHPSWIENSGLCSRCLDYYHTAIVMEQRVLPEIGPYFSIKTADDFVVLPTALRLNADPRFTGKGVCICFIDSGFYPHPDLVKHQSRIKAFVDVTTSTENSATDHFTGAWLAGNNPAAPDQWHGTMTSVVCAGDGYCSNGLYKGIASNASLVLLKVQDQHGRIRTEHIAAALQWVIHHRLQYDIRIVNMSLGDDAASSFQCSEVDRLAEELISQGVIIVAAAGNEDGAAIKPPANAPNVITVGGIDDHNQLGSQSYKRYHSSFGETIDGFMKPELVAHAIWIAAPILPATSEAAEACMLHELLVMQDALLPAACKPAFAQHNRWQHLRESNDGWLIRQEMMRRIREAKYISAHYMHVDGTSFAAPIVTAVIAQLLDANPQLTPAAVRNILFSTAQRLPQHKAQTQGFGLIQPRKALIKALNRRANSTLPASPFINRIDHCIEFYLQHDCATQVALAGDFTRWATDVWLMELSENGIWKIAIPMLSPGTYRYKFFIDQQWWTEDYGNPYKSPDEFNGFNSILLIDQ